MKNLLLFSHVFIFCLGYNCVASNTLNIGDTAPAITVTLDDNSQVNMGMPFSEGFTLIYFYPKSFTGGCTKQACNIRDHFDELQKLQTVVYGVSADSVKTQAEFRKKHQLQFHLVADTDLKLTHAFGVPVNDNNYPQRQSFIIYHGKVLWRDVKALPQTQTQNAVAAIKDILSKKTASR